MPGDPTRIVFGVSILPDPVTPEPGRRASDRVSRLAVAGELVATIAHDLRQPLTAIEMNIAAALRLLERGGDAAGPPHDATRLTEITTALRDALVEQRRMREALQALQDLTAMREPSFRPVDVEACVEDVVRFLSSDAFARRVLVEVTCATPVPEVSADETLVRQALLNILIYALDATSRSARPGGPLTIEIRPFDSDAVDVVVRHYGPRPDRADADGSGLALARSVIDSHAARLVIEGDPERGISIVTRWPVQAPVNAGLGTAVISGGSGAGE